MLDWLPADLALTAGLLLIGTSFLTSAISAAFGFLGFVFTEWLLLVLLMIISGLLGTWAWPVKTLS